VSPDLIGGTVPPALGAIAGLVAAILVGGLALWREVTRAAAERAWHGPAASVRPARMRGAIRVVLLAVAAGSATASVIGLTGLDAPDAAVATAPESLLFALDISRSMDAADVAPTRLAAAKTWLASLLERSSPRAAGLVLFSGEALLTCPLTSDLAALRLALDETASTQAALPGGTRLAEAVARSVAAFGEGRARRTLIVVSDGEDTAAGLAAAAAAAKQAGVVVHTVGVGTAQGIAMPVRRPPPGEAAPAGAETRITRLEDKGLRELATATGGLYVAGVDDRSLQQLAGRLRAPGAAPRPAQTVWWTALLLAAFVALALERAWGRRPARIAGVATVGALLVLALPVRAAAADGWEAIREGNAALDRGRTREAIAAYRRAAEDAEAAAVAWFNVGVALARQEDPKNAAMAFARAAAFYKSDAERSRAHYNRGVVLEQGAELEESARAFVAALRHDPSNEDARVNLAIVRARLERDRANDPPPPQQDDLEKAMQQVPQQSYAFTKGKKTPSPVPVGPDW
jgi:Ca-activated chloride channel family protein